MLRCWRNIFGKEDVKNWIETEVWFIKDQNLLHHSDHSIQYSAVSVKDASLASHTSFTTLILTYFVQTDTFFPLQSWQWYFCFPFEQNKWLLLHSWQLLFTFPWQQKAPSLPPSLHSQKPHLIFTWGVLLHYNPYSGISQLNRWWNW